jgi:GNAT superfamily N-acetyltransferase
MKDIVGLPLPFSEAGSIAAQPSARSKVALGHEIRPARREDKQRLAELSGQLGYPATAAAVEARLNDIQSRRDHLLLVAVHDEEVVGWVHAYVAITVESERMAELAGLVVDERCRSLGIGADLLRAIERWATAQGCVFMSVRSNILRSARTHAFYEVRGYERVKSQHVFRKPLTDTAKMVSK